MSGPMNVLSKSINWQDPSKFRISLTGAGADAINLPGQDILSMACQGIQLAEINTTPIEEYTAEEWRFATGRLENYQIQITFKDYNNFNLYTKFTNGIQKFMRMYPVDQHFNLEVYTAGDFGVNEFSKLLEFKDAILIAVGSATLDNSAVASVAEFPITMKASYVVIS